MKKFLLCLISLFFISSHAWSMQRPMLTKMALKGVNMTVAMGSMFKLAYDCYNVDNILSVLDNADEDVAALVRRQLKLRGHKNTENLVIKKGDPKKGIDRARSGHTMIVLTAVSHQALSDFIQEKIKPDEEILVPITLALDEHEIGHVNNHDQKKFAAACIALPLVVHPIGRLFAKNVCKFNPPKSNMRALGRAVGGGYVKSMVAWQTWCAYSRECEQACDDGVHDIWTLRFAFQNLYNNNTPQEVRSFPLVFDPLHPPLKKRIEKLDARIKAQEEAQAAKLAEEAKEKENK